MHRALFPVCQRQPIAHPDMISSMAEAMHRPAAFDQDASVEPLSSGRFRARVDPKWNIADAPNGGYLVTIALDAIGLTVPHPDPFAVTAHFPSRTEPGEAEVQVESVRTGRAHSTAVARLVQGGDTRVLVVATHGDLERIEGPTSVREPAPEFPPPEDCVRAEGPVAPVFVKQFDLRLTPDTATWASTKPSGTAEMCGWIRFADDREPDTRSLSLFADSFPPTIFNLGPAMWVPTLELTVYVRARPSSGWLQCRFQTRYLIKGYLEEDGEIWDSTGQLVALSRQLARVHT
jgi:acyl-CoA thioesterase